MNENQGFLKGYHGKNLLKIYDQFFGLNYGVMRSSKAYMLAKETWLLWWSKNGSHMHTRQDLPSNNMGGQRFSKMS